MKLVILMFLRGNEEKGALFSVLLLTDFEGLSKSLTFPEA